jgi:hypothetical protein
VIVITVGSANVGIPRETTTTAESPDGIVTGRSELTTENSVGVTLAVASVQAPELAWSEIMSDSLTVLPAEKNPPPVVCSLRPQAGADQSKSRTRRLNWVSEGEATPRFGFSFAAIDQPIVDETAKTIASRRVSRSVVVVLLAPPRRAPFPRTGR